MAASAESLISKILRGAEGPSYDFDVFNSEASYNAAQYGTPRVCVCLEKISRRKLGQGFYYHCKIYTGDSAEGVAEETIIDQDTYNKIKIISEAPGLIARFQTININDIKALSAYVAELNTKIQSIDYPTTIEALNKVKKEAQQLLLEAYGNRFTQFNRQLGYAETINLKSLEGNTFEAMLECIVDISFTLQMVEEGAQAAFFECQLEMMQKLTTAISDRLNNEKDILALAEYYIGKIIGQMSNTQHKATQEMLMDMINYIHRKLYTQFDDNFSRLASEWNALQKQIESGAAQLQQELEQYVASSEETFTNHIVQSQEKLNGYALLQDRLARDIAELHDKLIDYMNWLDKLPNNNLLSVQRNEVYQLSRTVQTDTVVRERPRAKKELFPLHHLVADPQSSLENIKNRIVELQEQGYKIDLSEKDLSGQTLLDLVIKRNNEEITKYISRFGTAAEKERIRQHIATFGTKAQQDKLQAQGGLYGLAKKEKEARLTPAHPTTQHCMGLLNDLEEPYKKETNRVSALQKLDAIRELLNKSDARQVDKTAHNAFIKKVYDDLAVLLDEPTLPGLDVLYKNIFEVDIVSFLEASKTAIANKVAAAEAEVLGQEAKIQKEREGLQAVEKQIGNNAQEIEGIDNAFQRTHVDEAKEMDTIKADSRQRIDKSIEAVRSKRMALITELGISIPENLHFPYNAEAISPEDIASMLEEEKNKLKLAIQAGMAACLEEIEGVKIQFGIEINVAQIRELEQFIEKFYIINAILDQFFFKPQFETVRAIIERCTDFLLSSDQRLSSIKYKERKQPQEPNFNFILEMGGKLVEEIDKILSDENVSIPGAEKIALKQYRDRLNSELDIKKDWVSEQCRLFAENRLLKQNRPDELKRCLTVLDAVGLTAEDIQQEFVQCGEGIARAQEYWDERRIGLSNQKEALISDTQQLNKKKNGYEQNVEQLNLHLAELERNKKIFVGFKERLDQTICQPPFQLFLVEDFTRIDRGYYSAAVNAVMLDDQNRVSLIIGGQVVKEFFVSRHVRGKIPYFRDLNSATPVRVCNDYEDACAVIEYVTEQIEKYTLFYDVGAEKLSNQEYIGARVARQKGEGLVSEQAQNRREAAERQALETRHEKRQEKAAKEEQGIGETLAEKLKRLKAYQAQAAKMSAAKENAVNRIKDKQSAYSVPSLQAIQQHHDVVTGQIQQSSFKFPPLQGEPQSAFKIPSLQEELEALKERHSELKLKLEQLKRRKDQDANAYQKGPIAEGYSPANIYQRKDIRSELCVVGIDPLLDYLEDLANVQSASPAMLKLQEQLNTAYLKLRNGKVDSADFMKQIDELTEGVFDFIAAAQPTEIEIVQELMAKLLPVLFRSLAFDAYAEVAPIASFREADEAIAKAWNGLLKLDVDIDL